MKLKCKIIIDITRLYIIYQRLITIKAESEVSNFRQKIKTKEI